MNNYIINLKSGIDCASPYVNKYSSGFDSIRFYINDTKDFSDCTFAVVVSVLGQTSMISENAENLVRGTEEEKLYLDWTLGSEITCAEGVVVYQVVAYTTGESGSTETIWYSPEGRILVGDSIDTTEYEVAQIGANPGIVMQILAKTTANEAAIDNAQSNLENVTLRLSVQEAETEKNGEQIMENIKSISENAENISLLDSRASILNAETESIKSSISSHYSNISNPHSVTKDQVGLGNADNTSDMDKPVSLAVSSALDSLEEKITFENFSDNQFIRHQEITPESAGYISAFGSVVSTSDYSYSKPISLLKGEKIVVTAKGFTNGVVTISVISRCTNGAYVPVASSIDNAVRQYEYTAKSDCQVVISYTNGYTVEADVYLCVRDSVDDIRSKIGAFEKTSILKTKKESLNYLEEEKFGFPYENCSLNTRGVITEYSGRAVSDYIDLKKFGQIYKYGYGSLLVVLPCCFYDDNYEFIGGTNLYTPEEFKSINGHTKAIEYGLMANARYIRIVHEMSRTAFTYIAVPRKNIYTSPDVLLDAPTRFMLNSDETIVNLGDSIFGNNDTLTGVSNLIAHYTNATVYNCAFGGTRMSTRGSTTTGYDKFDFSTLVDAIVSGDYSSQESALETYSLTSYYAERLERLKNVDFNNVNIVTLNFGTNDYTGGISISTFKTRATQAIGKLQAAFPHISVVLITPSWRCWLNDDGSFLEDGNTRTYIGGTLIDFYNADIELAKELNIPLIDVYNIGINKNNWSYYFAPSDTTHQDVNGRIKLAKVIAKGLAQI